ncbi:MAG TPA: cupin domain-containing protein [Bryobacteraceae bacterium]|nr:cupin domain-containing protein [Bryobacteraceae bacterium]
MKHTRALCSLNYAAGLMALVSGLWMLEAQQSSNFTGGKVIAVDEKPSGNIAHFRFEPGARTKWHSHSGGQIILVEEGVARTQLKGGPVIELHAGETTYAPPGVMHWHGAAPDQAGVQYNVSRGMTTWGEEVSEQEFAAAPKKR